MNIVAQFAQFLISEWIWSFTFGIHHILINTLIMTLLFMFVAKQRIITAMMYALSAQLFSIVLFTFLVHIVLDMLFHISFDYEVVNVVHPLVSSVALGVIYAVLQAFFFYILSCVHQFPLRQLIYVVFLSNLISSLVVFRFLGTTI